MNCKPGKSFSLDNFRKTAIAKFPPTNEKCSTYSVYTILVSCHYKQTNYTYMEITHVQIYVWFLFIESLQNIYHTQWHLDSI
jgi:hypothetical protein